METRGKEQVITAQYGKRCDGETLEQCVSCERRGTSLRQGFEEGFPVTARKNQLNEEEESILAEATGHGQPGGKKQCALVFMEHNQWKESDNRRCGSFKLGSEQAGLTDHDKATGVYPENLRESLKGPQQGGTREMSQ